MNDATFALLKKVDALSGGDAGIYLTVTTHEDLGWINSIEKSTIARDTLWLTPFLARLRQSADFRMDIEQSSIVMEYLRRHPERKDTVAAYLRSGRMLAGASYTQVYEDLYSGESLARQFYFGKKWLRDNLGYNSTIYYNSDVPGRSLQMPQLMAKAGVTGMFFSRFGMGLYNWTSPDGSYVTSYSPGHYIDFYNILAKTDTAAIRTMAEQAVYWLLHFNDRQGSPKAIPAVLNYEFGWDQKPVRNLYPFITRWNAISRVRNTEGETISVRLPRFQFATFDQFIGAIKSSSSHIPAISGERPNVWVYIHGPSHHWAVSASREADVLLPAAEKWWSLNRLVDPACEYPTTALDEAWEAKIYPDHGWGGKEGQSTDDMFLAKYTQAKTAGRYLLTTALQRLASHVATSPAKGMPVVVFNNANCRRTDAVSFDLPASWGNGPVKVYDDAGRLVPAQSAWTSAGSGPARRSLSFVAAGLPSMGYATWYLKPGEAQHSALPPASDNMYENRFYKLRFGPGGITSLIDKSTGKQIIADGPLAAGEVFTLQSVGTGAGEFDAVQQPTLEDFDRLGSHDNRWTIKEQGPVYTLWHCRQAIRHAVVEEEIKVFNTIRRIDFDVSLLNWDGTLYREFRLALPVAAPHARVTYEVPFGKVEIGKDELPQPAGQIYMTLPREIHPRGMQNWMSASGDGFGVTLSSSTAAFDFMDVTGVEPRATLLQPILLASRRSCHSEGNEYLQTGDHTYHFSLTTYAQGWQAGAAFGRQANDPPIAIVNPQRAIGAALPGNAAFVSCDKQNVVITTMKKAEDDNGTVLRFYESEGKDVQVTFTFSRAIKTAYSTSLIEDHPTPLNPNGRQLTIRLGHNSIETIKIFWQ